ncbi:MAG: hypothetical protein ACREC8_12155 [Limisphaerales bacterium]
MKHGLNTDFENPNGIKSFSLVLPDEIGLCRMMVKQNQNPGGVLSIRWRDGFNPFRVDDFVGTFTRRH